MNVVSRPIYQSLLAFLSAVSVHGVSLQPIPNFGPNADGSIRPGDLPFLTSDGSRFQRGMAYNPATDHLIIVNRNPIGSETINIIDATTGTNVGILDTCCPGINNGNTSFLYNMVAVADDGAIYVGNLTTSSSFIGFNLYRWASETNSQTLVFSGDPRNGNPSSTSTRWGDTISIRGAGTNTQILLATQSGTLAAILRPTDDTLTTFSSTALVTDVPVGGIGYGIAFGAGDTFWGKGASSAGNPLYRLSFDLNAGTATTLQVYPLSTFPGRTGPLAVQPSSNLLAGIEMVADADHVRLYDISTITNPPLMLDRKEFPTNVANNIFSGSIAFAPGRLYALNSDNGILGFNIVAGSPSLPPLIYQQPLSLLTRIGSNVVLSVGADGTTPLSYQWMLGSTNIPDATNSILTFTNIQLSNSGAYVVIVTNNLNAQTSSTAILSVISSSGSVAIYDPFPYQPGTVLAGQGGWIVTSTAANGAIESGNLDVPGLAPSVGNRYTWTNSSSVRLPVGSNTNGAIYASFAFRLDNPSTSTGNETFAGFSSGTASTFPLKFNVVGDGAGNYQIGIYKSGGTTAGALATNVFTSASTVFVVGRYTFNSGTADDTCDLWINPDPATFGAASPPAASVGGIGNGATDGAVLDYFFWRWSSGYPKRTSDELRVGYSWADVTPPAAPKLTATLSGANIVISWPTNGSSGFVLQSNPVVSDAGGWETESASVVVSGSNNTVTVSANTGRKFFRLAK